MWGDGAWQEVGAYWSIRRRMTDHIRNSSREARLLQTKRRIDNPGKLLDKEGPWFDWVEAWVKTGWATMDGGNRMPLRASEIRGQQTGHTCTPWAWSVPAGLQFFWWRTHASPQPYQLLVRAQRSPVRLVTPSSIVIYPDGSHDSRKPCAVPVAGWGFTAVCLRRVGSR